MNQASDPYNKNQHFRSIQRIQLSDKPSPRNPIIAKCIKDKGKNTSLIIMAPRSFIQKKYKLILNGKVLKEGRFWNNKRTGQAQIRYEYSSIDIDGELANIKLEDGSTYPIFIYNLMIYNVYII